MKQRGNVTGEWIDARKIRALAEITSVAGQRQVIHLVASTVLPGDDVFDVMSEGAVRLRK